MFLILGFHVLAYIIHSSVTQYELVILYLLSYSGLDYNPKAWGLL